MAEEIVQVEQPLATIFDPTTCVRKGLCPVTKIRGQDTDPLESHSLYFEQHGTGPEKLVLILGLNSNSFSWEKQVEYFGRSDKYSVLLFDNRGVGNSGTPKGPYRTSDMAQDTITLLDYVGWLGKRDLHIVGISMGGMIAMEIASRIPERIVSLILCVTTAGGNPWTNLPPWKGMTTLVRTLMIKEPRERVALVIDSMFPHEWLESKVDRENDDRTNRQFQEDEYMRRVAIARVQEPMGAVSQMYAGLTHYVSPARLHEISKAVPKVLILTGDNDHLVDPRNSAYLKKNMPEAEYVHWEKTGHAIHLQHPERFSAIVERAVSEGREKAKNMA